MGLRRKNIFIDISIFNLCLVAFLGVILRSKMLFDMPFINFNNLLEAHYHFAIGGWVTPVLLVLMINNFLPVGLSEKPIYRSLLAGIIFSSTGMLISYYLNGESLASEIFSFLFILTTYITGWVFIKDVRSSGISPTVSLLSTLSIVCLILSSIGPIILYLLFSSGSLNAILYRDSLFTYLHLMYNGFFTLAVFSLFVYDIEPTASAIAKKNIRIFVILLSCSILPSLFLSYLWQDPNDIFRIIAIAGSFLLILTLIWFIISMRSLLVNYKGIPAIVRNTGIVSMGAFMLKLLLQSFTIYTPVGNAVFGDRPMIIGYLHLVFLVFVTLFILIQLTREGSLNVNNKFTKYALITFTAGVVLNEAVLMSQGFGAMFIKSSDLFQWLLWLTSIVIFTGALLILIARNKKLPRKYINER